MRIPALALIPMLCFASVPALAQSNTPPPPAATALTADQIAARVQAFYDRTQDFSADFAQLSQNRLSGQNDTRNGHVRFSRPGRMRWDYTTPAGDVIVSNGSTLSLYEAAAHQVIQTPMQQSQIPSAVSFLMGTGRLADDFTFTLLPAPPQWQGYALELHPRQPNPSFESIVFYVEPANFQVVRTAVLDAQGNSNRFTFTNVTVNTNIPPTAFQWSAPPRTQIVRP